MRLGRVTLAIALTLASGRSMAASPAEKKPAAAATPAPGQEAPAKEDNGDALPANPTFDTAAGGPKALLTFGMTKPTGEAVAMFSADELNTYLSAKLGGPVATKLYDDAAALGDALASGAIEAAWLTPPAYVRASVKGGIQPIVKLSRHGATSYRSILFAKASSKAAKLDDLSGKSMAWLGEGSASGSLYPRQLLRKAGKDPSKFFKSQTVLGDHADICKSVLDGTVDAGATFADEVAGDGPLAVDGCREAGFDPKQFKVLAKTDPIPNDVIAIRADLPAEVASHFQAALLAMASGEKTKAELRDIFHADGFGPSSDKDFAPVRDVVSLSNLK